MEELMHMIRWIMKSFKNLNLEEVLRMNLICPGDDFQIFLSDEEGQVEMVLRVIGQNRLGGTKAVLVINLLEGVERIPRITTDLIHVLGNADFSTEIDLWVNNTRTEPTKERWVVVPERLRSYTFQRFEVG